MSLQLINNQNELIPINLIDWNVDDDSAGGTLHIPDIDAKYPIQYPLPIIQKTENYASCKIFLFKNRFKSKEDHCFQVSINGNRKGMIFPIKIYSNTSFIPIPGNSKVEDFFLRFLHIAYYHLLNSIDVISNPISFKNINELDELKIEHFYDDETVIYLYHEDKTTNLDIFRFYPSLLKFGYVPIIKASDYLDIEMLVTQSSKHPLYSFNQLSEISIKNVKSELITEKYIYHLFKSILKTKLTPAARFLILYQVIELLIDKIAKEYFLNDHPFDIDTYYKIFETRTANSYREIYDNIYDIQKKIQKSTEKIKEEIKRISILIGEKAKLDIDNYSYFISISKKIIGEKKCTTLSDYIYQLRNKIIHDFHNLINSYEDIDELLIEVNIEFEKIVADIIIEYK